jgi:hydrogenase/urease accessory protein HupE
MGDFSFYFKEGIYHITDLKGFDHILFVMAVCLPFLFQDWRKVLILITAFTIGHSITLALSIFNTILIPSKWIEFLIPLTIFITAIRNLFARKNQSYSKWTYGAVLLFGFIHGMGFSNYLKSMMSKSESIITQLLAFNIGLELGQLIIVSFSLAVSYIFVQLLKIERREWAVFTCGGIVGLSLLMAVERNPF